MSSESSDSIQVAIRVRPLGERELNTGCQNIIKKTSNEPQILVGGTRNSSCLFTFNHVFSETDSQETVYTNSVQHMIKQLFEGYNVTILAYGQTGSGKTHTMGTNYNGIPSESMGIIPRAVLEIFEKVRNMEVQHNITIKCSFVELYNELLFDLLSNSTNRDDCIVDIREDTTKGIIIPGLTKIEVNSIEEIISCLVKGSGDRTVGATAMNAVSSRSHAIFTITMECAKKDNPTIKTCSRFHLVDLAGSERTKKTKATGNRLKEGIKINQGLFALGKCIMALDGNNSNHFVQYRESKLTRLLQDSLGGNSVTLLIACVSPSDSNIDETLNTLNYANRAKNIKNKPIINYDSETAELENWEKKAQALRQEILNFGNTSCLPVNNDGNVTFVEKESISMLKNELKEAQCQNLDLQTIFRNAMTRLLNVELKDVLIEKTYDDLIKIVNKISDTINSVMETDIHESHLYTQKIRTFTGEIKSLLASIVSSGKGYTDDEQNLIIVHDTLGNNSTHDDMNIENFHKKQLEFTNEIQQLNEQIAIKEVLQRQILSNLPNFLADNSSLREKVSELENKIKTLETERIELERQLHMADEPNVASEKEVNVGLNRISTLEKHLQTLVKQHKQQQKLLELREADAQKIKQLQIEIKELKSTRVQITREMKKYNNIHKKWRFTKNMEINRIRGLERKKQYEMSKISLRNKQQQYVLKRRIAEAFAGIKNLELKIEKKRLAQLKRRPPNIVKTGYFKTEIDVILAITGTEINLEQVKQNREHLMSEIELLKQERPLQSNEIVATEKRLKELNEQITNHHQTIIHARKDDTIKELVAEIRSTEDACEVVKYIFGEIVCLNKESSEKDSACKMIMKSNEALCNKLSLHETNQGNIKQTFISDLNSIERRNEKAVGQLLHDLHFREPQVDLDNTPIRDKLLIVMRKKKREYVKILSDLDLENEQLLKELSRLRERTKTAGHNMQNPDWKFNEESGGTICHRKPSTELIKCGCIKTCSSKLCKCRKNITKCNDNCKCNKSCSNVGGEEQPNYNDDDSDENNKNGINIEKHITCIGNEIKSKKPEAPLNKLDFTTFCYPNAKKKRAPFYKQE